MEHGPRAAMCAVVGVTTSLLLMMPPTSAQSLGSGQYCQNTNRGLVCNPASGPSGGRVYEQWENGAPARAAGSSGYHPPANDPYQFPSSFGAYSNLRGFGQ
jgi:hypothetical protein